MKNADSNITIYCMFSPVQNKNKDNLNDVN